MRRIAKRYFRPIFGKLAGVIRQGIAAGDFRAVNPIDFLPSVAAIIVFYFSAAPVMKALTKVDPLSPERIRERRAFVLDFISAALFSRTTFGKPATRRQSLLAANPQAKRKASVNADGDRL